VEVHLTDPATREPFRSVNFLSDIALHSIVGHGADGYLEALDFIVTRVHSRW
jgi:3-dehydroquinate dehydratase-2